MSLTQRLFSEAFRDMQRAMQTFEQPLFHDGAALLGSTPARTGGAALTNSFLRSYPAADLIEKPDAYELHAELPGYDKNNIKIELADNRTLVLSGTVKEQKEIHSPPASGEGQTAATKSNEGAVDTDENRVVAKKENEGQVVAAATPQYWINERVSSSFSRAFQFPAPIKSEDIKAHFDNGVLKIIVPKSTQEQSKQINIE